MTAAALQTKLSDEAVSIETRAEGVAVTNESEYSDVCEYLRSIRMMQERISDYWEPMRISAKKAYDDVLAHKKSMTEPLIRAEKILKDKISKYLFKKRTEEEKRRKALEEKARREAEARLAEAKEAEEKGDTASAEYSRAVAEMLQNAPAAITSSQAVKTDGVTTRKSWNIISIDTEKVPDYISGVLIRPVDAAAVKKLIAASRGTIEIPGITYEETSAISVRTK